VKKAAPTLAVLGASALFGTTGTSQALGPAGATPLGLGAVRLAVGGGALALLAILGRPAGGRRWRPHLGALLAGGVAVAAYQLCWFAGLRRTGVALGTLVGIGSGPVFAGLIQLARRRGGLALSWIAGTALTLAGVALLGDRGEGGGGADRVGLAIMAGAGLSYAVYAQAAKEAMAGGLDEVAAMAGVFGAGALLLAPLLLVEPLGWLASPLARLPRRRPAGAAPRPPHRRPRLLALRLRPAPAPGPHRRHPHPGRAPHRGGAGGDAPGGAPGPAGLAGRGGRGGRPHPGGAKYRRARRVALAMTRTAAALALALVPFLARAHEWRHLDGDGNKVRQARAVGDFDAVRMEGSLDVEVKVGVPASATVTIDANLQPEVDVRVEGTTLVVSLRRGVSYRGVGKVEIGAPRLGALSLHGSGDARIEGASGGDLRLAIVGSGDLRWKGGAARTLEAEIEGSGDIDLSGTAEELRASVDGSGDVHARGLTARDARIRVNGSGDVDVTLGGGVLDAEVSGSGDVRWSGEARVERAAVSGSGEISRR
jgi:drug/metabolite transporter (DMT)-like permease